MNEWFCIHRVPQQVIDASVGLIPVTRCDGAALTKGGINKVISGTTEVEQRVATAETVWRRSAGGCQERFQQNTDKTKGKRREGM